MYFVLYCLDRPDSMALRLANRPAHLDYARSQPSIRMAGPLLGADGESMVGSMFVLEVPDRAAADAFHQADPYTRAGLWQRVDIHPFRWLLPAAQ